MPWSFFNCSGANALNSFSVIGDTILIDSPPSTILFVSLIRTFSEEITGSDSQSPEACRFCCRVSPKLTAVIKSSGPAFSPTIIWALNVSSFARIEGNSERSALTRTPNRINMIAIP